MYTRASASRLSSTPSSMIMPFQPQLLPELSDHVLRVYPQPTAQRRPPPETAASYKTSSIPASWPSTVRVGVYVRQTVPRAVQFSSSTALARASCVVPLYLGGSSGPMLFDTDDVGEIEPSVAGVAYPESLVASSSGVASSGASGK